MWSDKDQWAKDSLFEKIFHIFQFLAYFGLWILVVLRVIQDYKMLSIPRLAEGISLAIGGVITFISFLLFNYRRDELTMIFNKLDDIYMAVPKKTEIELEWWQRATKFYILEIKLLLAAIAGGILICGPEGVLCLINGDLYYDTVIPLSVEAYTPGWWIQYIYQSLVPTLSGIFFSLKEFMLISPVFHISLIYDLQTDRMMDICKRPNFNTQEEMAKLKTIMRELNELEK